MKIILENWKKYINESDEKESDEEKRISWQRAQNRFSEAIKTNDPAHILQAIELFHMLVSETDEQNIDSDEEKKLKIEVLKEPKYDRWDPNRFEPFEKYWKRTRMSEPEIGVFKITNDQIETMLFLKNDIKDEDDQEKYIKIVLDIMYDNNKIRSGINYDTIRYFNILF